MIACRLLLAFSVIGYQLPVFTSATFAHKGKPHRYADLLYTWSFDPLIIFSFALWLGLYFASVALLYLFTTSIHTFNRSVGATRRAQRSCDRLADIEK